MLMLQLLNIAIIVQVYVDIFATAILLFGGSLGCYGELVVQLIFVNYLHVSYKDDNVH